MRRLVVKLRLCSTLLTAKLPDNGSSFNEELSPGVSRYSVADLADGPRCPAGSWGKNITEVNSFLDVAPALAGDVGDGCLWIVN